MTVETRLGGWKITMDWRERRNAAEREGRAKPMRGGMDRRLALIEQKMKAFILPPLIFNIDKSSLLMLYCATLKQVHFPYLTSFSLHSQNFRCTIIMIFSIQLQSLVSTVNKPQLLYLPLVVLLRRSPRQNQFILLLVLQRPLDGGISP